MGSAVVDCPSFDVPVFGVQVAPMLATYFCVNRSLLSPH